MSSTDPSDRDTAPLPPTHGTDVSPSQARQGRKGTRVLWMLVASMVLVVIAFLLVARTNSGRTSAANPGNGHTLDAAAANSFHAPEPAPKQPAP